MRNLLSILFIIICIASYSQEDDFFWSYTHANAYDTIKIYNASTGSYALSGFFSNYSGDSLIYVTNYGSSKIASNKNIYIPNLTLVQNSYGYIISKHNDLYSVSNINGRQVVLSDISQVKSLKNYNTDYFGFGITSSIFYSNPIIENLYLNETFISISPSGVFDLSYNGKIKTISIQNTAIQSLILPTSPDLSDIFIPENQSLTTITFGDLNPNIWRFYGYNSHFDQINIDKILKYFIDSNRNPNDLGIGGTSIIDLCGTRNSYPSSIGYEYVSILTNRGWFVCVNNNTTTPIVSTNDPSFIGSNSATSGGNIASDGGASVTVRGVCWDTSSNPNLSNSYTLDGSGIGLFTSSISGLLPNITYHTRAYATNSNGTSYGEDKSFTTLAAAQYAPELITITANNVTTTSVTSGGEITSDGNYEIIEKGVCWNTSGTPTYLDNKTNDGTGTADFVSNISGLSPSTTYYVRAYARNRRDAGGSYVYALGYGQEIIFTTASTTQCSLPTITTNSVNTITTNSAISGGNVTNDGGCEVTVKGVCWDTTGNPTIANSKTIDGSGLGSYTSNISGLSSGTTYYVRAYATNSSGTSYSSQLQFTTTCGLPAFQEASCGSATSSSITISATINANNCIITSRGFQYSTDATFNTVLGNVTVGSGVGSYSTTITGLLQNTHYYFRPWATNPAGTYYADNLVGSGCTTLANPTSSIVANLSGYTDALTATTIQGTWVVTLNSPATADVTIPIIVSNLDNSEHISLPVTITSGATTGTTGITYTLKSSSWTADAYFGTMPSGYTAGTTATITIPATTINSCPEIGESYGGGIVVYLYSYRDPGYIPGECHGIIMAPVSPKLAWNGALGSVATGANGITLGTGTSNTDAIYGTHGTSINYLAKYCYDLEYGGYSDWVMPSSGEIDKIYLSAKVLNAITIASNLAIASSSEPSYATTKYFRLNFDLGYWWLEYKYFSSVTIPIRYF